MKFKKVIIPEFKHSDEFGKFTVRDVAILVAADSEITSSNFNQNKHDYSLSSNEIERISQISVRRFYDGFAKKIMNEKKVLSAREINGIKIFLNVNGTELGDLIGLDKSNISICWIKFIRLD